MFLSLATWLTINSGLTYTAATSVIRDMKYKYGIMYVVGYFDNTDLVTKFYTPNITTRTLKKIII